MTQLEDLQKMTTIVADTGDIESIKQFRPTEATTNPSLILAAAQKPEYRPLIEAAKKYAKGNKVLFMDKLFVTFGEEILKLISGRVSTEVDAHLSFDTQKSIEKARKLIALYEEVGVPRERILIKLASTWEGAEAAKVLEREGIHCNMTLMFSLPQAIICAEAKATLISPFVGRIYDWYKKNEPNRSFTAENDPGVLSVKEIYTYYKKFGYPTQVMGASFRYKEQIVELAGCDLLTISPDLLSQLKTSSDPVPRRLSPEQAQTSPQTRLLLDEAAFRWHFNENPMALDKLAEGIRRFAQDYSTLEQQY